MVENTPVKPAPLLSPFVLLQPRATINIKKTKTNLYSETASGVWRMLQLWTDIVDSRCHDSPEMFDWVQVRTLSSLPELTLWLENTALLEGELSTPSEALMLQIRFTSACPGLPLHDAFL